MKRKEFDALCAYLHKRIGYYDELGWNHDICSEDIARHRTARNELYDVLRDLENGYIPGIEVKEKWMTGQQERASSCSPSR